MQPEITICFAGEEDVFRISEISEEAYRQMEHKEWFVRDDMECIKRHIEQEGFILKALVSGETAGFLMVRRPGAAMDNLGAYLDLSEEERNLVAHMETAAVDINYRGLGIQKRLMAEGEAILRSQGYKYLMGTAHPDNLYSVNNFLKLGYEIIAEDKKYGGLSRYIFCRIVYSD